MNFFKRTTASIISIAFLAAGCAQLQNVPLTQAEQGIARPDVQVGERVVVTTRDGVKHRFQVTAMDAESLRGETDRIAYADMQRLDVQKKGDMRFSKTALVVGAVVLGAVAVGAASSGGSSGGY